MSPSFSAVPAVELEDVHVVHTSPTGPVHALSGISHAFVRSTSTAIVGRSGSGKSTLIATIALLQRPSRGIVRINGQAVSNARENVRARLRSEHIGVVFQSFHLDANLTAAENILLPWTFSLCNPLTQRQARDRSVLLLTELGLAEHASRTPGKLSGGQRQRVAIARALFNGPDLLIADEPTGNLDEDTASEVASELFSLPERFNTTVLVVTHDESIADMANHTVRLRHGQIDSGQPV